MSTDRTPRQIIGDDAYMQLVFEGYEVIRADALPASKEAEAVAKMHRRAQIAEGWLVSLRSLASSWENGPEPKSDNQFKEFWSGWKTAAKHLREQVEQIAAKNEAKLSAHPPTDAGVSEAHYYSKAESAYDEADERRAALSQNEGDRK